MLRNEKIVIVFLELFKSMVMDLSRSHFIRISLSDFPFLINIIGSIYRNNKPIDSLTQKFQTFKISLKTYKYDLEVRHRKMRK